MKKKKTPHKEKETHNRDYLMMPMKMIDFNRHKNKNDERIKTMPSDSNTFEHLKPSNQHISSA